MLLALYEPEIPPNTGNIARLCAAFGLALHLIEPLGFKLEDRYLKRAGLDYWPHVRLYVWQDWTSFIAGLPENTRLIMATTRGREFVQNFAFQTRDALVFGPETRGLPAEILAQSPHHVRIPIINMDSGGARSLNLSTAAGIIAYAALLRCGQLPGA